MNEASVIIELELGTAASAAPWGQEARYQVPDQGLHWDLMEDTEIRSNDYLSSLARRSVQIPDNAVEVGGILILEQL